MKLVTSTDATFHRADMGITPFKDPVVDELVVGRGVAMGVVGEYETPLALAATWNTEPPPYS